MSRTSGQTTNNDRLPHGVDEETLRLARVIWDYHQLRQELRPADVMIVLGTNDLRVAEFAAGLYRGGYAPVLVCTGGVAHEEDLLATSWAKTEAEMFADVIGRSGVPADAILVEPRATNTAENLRFTRELLRERGIAPRNVLIAVKPFMQRRVHATMAVEWSGMQATLASPSLSLEEYFTAELPAEKVIHILVGDLQRIWAYARRGWSAPQPLPAEVKAAYHELIARGFTQHLIPEEVFP